MQVNSKVTAGFVTPYQRNANGKHRAGFVPEEKSGFLPGDAAENPDAAEIAPNSEFYRARMSQGAAGNRGIRSAEEEAAYQIGAQSFTEDEWDELLEKFDATEDTIRRLMRERHAKEAEKRLKKELLERAKPMKIETLLFAESTTCIYPAANSADGDIRYITWYTKKGIFCRRTGQKEGYEWSVTFKKKEQYDKVMGFINQFPADCDMRFAAKENFWTAFLKDEIDRDSLMEYLPSKLQEQCFGKVLFFCKSIRNNDTIKSSIISCM